MTPALSETQWARLREVLTWAAGRTNERGVPLGIAHVAGELLAACWTVRESSVPRTRVRPPHQGESASARKKRIRDEVRARDRGCTARGITLNGTPIRCMGALHLEHQWGVGKAETTIENTRMMCARHHDLKQRGVPSRAFWIEHFRAHCERHGYVDEVAKCERMLALEAGQHPERVRTPVE